MEELFYSKEETIKYYDEQSSSYDEATYYTDRLGFYPANLYRLNLTKKIISHNLNKNFKVFDAGCGTGELLVYLLQEGYDASGCDISSEMVKITNDKISKISKKIPVLQTGLDDLSQIEDASFDAVFAMGVFPYIPEEIETKSYSELNRILKPGGMFISAHENELFDLFTFNKYSVKFFKKNVLPLIIQSSSDISHKDLVNDFENLISNPKAPQEKNALKAPRDLIFTKSENPIIFDKKLYSHGFIQQEQLFYHFHAAPPLLRNKNKKLIEVSKELEAQLSDNWLGNFLASTFISVAKKN